MKPTYSIQMIFTAECFLSKLHPIAILRLYEYTKYRERIYNLYPNVRNGHYSSQDIFDNFSFYQPENSATVEPLIQTTW